MHEDRRAPGRRPQGAGVDSPATLLRRLGSRLRPPRPAAEPSGYDAWLRHYFADTLDPIEAAGDTSGASFELFRDLDDDLWAVLLTREYSAYPRIRALLPGWPDISVQQRWNGWTGLRLLNESKAFYAMARQIYAQRSPLPLAHSRVLDFGCGWGRLTRFFARDVGAGSLFACDPAQEIIDVCEQTRVPARLARCDYLPRRLPFEERFDLVFAFSVFTHLSERAHRACLESIHASLAPQGLLLVTVRPPEYLRHCERLHPLLDGLGPDFLSALEQPRYLYVPHPPDADHPQFHGGEMTHGETVISLAYVRERWSPLFELLDVFMLTEDPHQVVLALRRRG